MQSSKYCWGSISFSVATPTVSTPLPWRCLSVPYSVTTARVHVLLINGGALGRNPQMKSCNEAADAQHFVNHSLILPTSYRRAGEYSLIDHWRVIMRWLWLARKCRHCASIRSARLLIFYLVVKPSTSINSMGGFSFPEYWEGKGHGGG